MDALYETFVVLLVVLDPIGMVPVFIALTRDASASYQRRTAVRGMLYATAILLVFFFVGDVLLAALGITLPAFRIAGGVLLFLLSMDMIFARQSGMRSTTPSERWEAEHKADVSVFPLAFPLVAGPGALTTVLLMSASAPDTWLMLGMLVILLAVLGMTLLALLFAPVIMHLLGQTGANAISRVLGLVLAALAVQFVLDGVKTSFGV